MSADDFQTKYSSVMEGMLRSAVAETTKLFETMVDELKAEISRLKKENEDLKSKYNHPEHAGSRASVRGEENETPRGISSGLDKRDTAVQCNLVPLPTMLVEQCQPLRDSLQNQTLYEDMEYGLQEHNYVSHREDNDDESSLQTVLKQEADEPTPFSGQVVGEIAGSPRTTACGTVNKGSRIYLEVSTEDVPLSRKHEKTPVAQEIPSLEVGSSLQGVQNQTSEPEHSLVISLDAIKDDLDEESEMSLKMSEMGPTAKFTSAEHPVVVAQQTIEKEQPSVVLSHCQKEGEMLVNSTLTDVTLQQYDKVHLIVEKLAAPPPQKNEVANEALKAMTGGKSSPQTVLCKRGQPPKKAKHLQQPEEVLHSSSTTVAQRMVISPLLDEVQVLSAVHTVNKTASEFPKVSPVKSKKASSVIAQSVRERANTALEKNVDNQEVGSLSVSEVSLRKGYSTNNEKTCESHNLSKKTDEAEIQAPNKKALSAKETYTPQTSPQPKHRSASVTIQDAMLLVEAMNQSTEENTVSSLQTLVASPQTKCGPLMGKLQTTDEIPGKPATLRLSVVAPDLTGKLPVTKLSTSRQSNMGTLKAATKDARDAAPNSEVQDHLTGVVPNPQDVVTPFSTTKISGHLSAATQTNIGSLQQHTLHHLMSVTPGNAVPKKIIVMPRSSSVLMPQKIAALSSNQVSAVIKTVVAARNTSLRSTPTVASSSLKIPSFSSVPQKTIYVTTGKLLPIIPSQSTDASKNQQRESLLQSNMKIIIPRRSRSNTFVLASKQDSTAPASAVVASPQLRVSSQELEDSLDAHTTSDELDTLSQMTDDVYDNLESQTSAVPQTTNALLETRSSLNRPVGQAVTSMFPVKQPGPNQRFSAKVQLTRLPFLVSSKESVSLSNLISNGSSELQSMLKESTTKNIIPSKPSEMPEVSTEIYPSLKEMSLAGAVKTHLEEAPASSEMSSVLEGLQDCSYFQPFTSSSMLAPPIMTEPSDDDPAYNLDKEIISNTVQRCTLPNPHIKEKQSTASIQLTAIASKDASDPHLQMTKTQFLAQLAVSPIVQAPEKASTNDPPDGTVCSEKTLQNTSFLARLRSHLKIPLKIRIAETNPEPCMKTNATTTSPKKLSLENGGPNDNTFPVSPKNGVVVVDVTSLNKTTYNPISPESSGLCEDDVTSKRRVSEPSTACSRRSKHTWNRTSSGIGIENRKSRSASPRTRSLTKDDISPKNTKSFSVSPKRASTTREVSSRKNTKSTCFTPKRASTVRDVTNTKMAKSPTVSLKRTSSQKTSNSVSPRMSKSTSESVLGNHRRSSFTKVNPGTKQIKRESNSFSPKRFSAPTGGVVCKKAKIETVSPSSRPLGKDGGGPTRTGESTPAKKPRCQDGTGSKKNIRVVNAKKLAKAAKAKTIAKIRNSQQQRLQNGDKTSQQAGNQASCAAVKKIISKAVWIPPKMPITKTPKKETRSLDHTAVYPPGHSIYSIPVKAPPIVSPLQPLLVIGGHLLKNQCGECGRILSSSAALESHVGLHTGSRPFSCTLCGKSFPDSKGLKRHGRVHRNGRIHVCPQCGKGFVYRFGLTKHLQMVHSRLKPFVCQICNKGFYTKRDVEAHIRSHTGEKPFHCNLCEKKFTRRVELNVHLRWHNGEKRHWCPYCGKGFLDFNNLKRHKYIHTGEKPHSCPHCPKCFTQSGHLKKHVKNVHKIE